MIPTNFLKEIKENCIKKLGPMTRCFAILYPNEKYEKDVGGTKLNGQNDLCSELLLNSNEISNYIA